jgi:hypothetical protein
MIRGRDSTNERMKLVRLFAPSVAQLITNGYPDVAFTLHATKHGHVVSAYGAVRIAQLDTSYPGCSTAEEIEAADAALNLAGATKGNTPSGRALEWTVRKYPDVRQWRVQEEFMRAFSRTLYGGVQFGGPVKPPPAPNRINIDVVSSYPFLAMGALPRVRDAVFTRGLAPGAVLIDIIGEQSERALFSRSGDATVYRSELSGWYVREEVDYHVALGRVKVHRVVRSLSFTRQDKYLARSVDHFFAHREKYARGTVERSALKSSLNGLLGKFAAPVSPWRPPRKGEARELAFSRRLVTLRCGRSLLVRDPALSHIYQRHANVIWTALTYARARVRLWQKMDELRAAGCRVLWCHTDAIIADAPVGYVPSVGNALGDWRLLDNPSEIQPLSEIEENGEG